MGNECPRFKPEILDELRTITTYSLEEILSWYKIFIRDFPRGQISVEEFKEAIQKLFLYGDSSMYAEHLFRSFDTNCDGVLDFKEFLIAMHMSYRGSFETLIQRTFKIFDIDGNGYISPEEMTKVVRSIYKIDFMTIPEDVAYRLSRKRTSKAFKLLDRNRDGKITLDEFIEGARLDPTVIYLFQCETHCLRWFFYFLG